MVHVVCPQIEAGEAVGVEVGEALVVEEGPRLPLDVAAEVIPNIPESIPVNPRPRSLDNLIRDTDLGIDEMWREGREPAPRSYATSLGFNDAEIIQYYTCAMNLEEVNFEVDCEGDTLILCCGVYRPISETCGCEHK